MRLVSTAAALFALAVSAFVPFGPHVLTHALEIRHVHEHDAVAHEHDHDAVDHHSHELQLSPDGARIASSGVQLARPDSPSFGLTLPRLDADASAAPIILARSLDPPPTSLSPQLAARCSGNRAPPTA